jgi:hypothetical protein
VEAAGGLAEEAVSSSSLDNELAAASLLLRAGALDTAYQHPAIFTN